MKPFEVRMLEINSCQDQDAPPLPSSTESKTSVFLPFPMKEVSNRSLSWGNDSDKPMIRRVINGRSGYQDFGEAFEPKSVMCDPRDSNITYRVFHGKDKLPTINNKQSLMITVKLSRNGIYWHHRGLYNLIKAYCTVNNQELQSTSLPSRWHEQAGAWSWILFRFPLSSEHSAKTCDIKLEAFLPSDLSCEITTLLFDELIQEY